MPTLTDLTGSLPAAFNGIAGQADLACLADAIAFTSDNYEPFTSVDADRLDPADFARMIDHTVLKPEATENDVRKLCAEAATHGFASVCVNGSFVELAHELLRDTNVAVCAVSGFPLGAMTTITKAAESSEAVRNGAGEVDMVIQVGMLKSGQFAYVLNDIRAVVDAVKERLSDAVVKVILENVLLTDEEKVAGCVLARFAGADFVKTSTGFSKAGATADDVALMREVVGGAIGVKAAGGIRSLDDARAMVRAGASRIGASASVAIVQGQVSHGNY